MSLTNNLPILRYDSFDYEPFRIDMITTKIREEIEFYEAHPLGKSGPLLMYIDYLKKRIGDSSPWTRTKIIVDHMGNRKEASRMDHETYMKGMDEMVYQRPWIKLKVFHKTIKIKEYVQNLEYQAKLNQKKILKNREQLTEELINGLTEKKFGKKNPIEYDPENMAITSIDCLSLNKKTKLYEVNWP